MDSGEAVVAYAEAVVRLEDLNLQMKHLADEIWLSLHGLRDD